MFYFAAAVLKHSLENYDGVLRRKNKEGCVRIFKIKLK